MADEDFDQLMTPVASESSPMCAMLATPIDRCRSELPNSKRARRVMCVHCSLLLTAKTFRKLRKLFFNE